MQPVDIAMKKAFQIFRIQNQKCRIDECFEMYVIIIHLQSNVNTILALCLLLARLLCEIQWYAISMNGCPNLIEKKPPDFRVQHLPIHVSCF